MLQSNQMEDWLQLLRGSTVQLPSDLFSNESFSSNEETHPRSSTGCSYPSRMPTHALHRHCHPALLRRNEALFIDVNAAHIPTVVRDIASKERNAAPPTLTLLITTCAAHILRIGCDAGNWLVGKNLDAM